MKIETQIEKISSFRHLELLANQIVEGFISGMHRVRFTDFRLNLQNIKCIMLVKALGILEVIC
jgi:hypothetical protein